MRTKVTPVKLFKKYDTAPLSPAAGGAAAVGSEAIAGGAAAAAAALAAAPGCQEQGGRAAKRHCAFPCGSPSACDGNGDATQARSVSAGGGARNDTAGAPQRQLFAGPSGARGCARCCAGRRVGPRGAGACVDKHIFGRSAGHVSGTYACQQLLRQPGQACQAGGHALDLSAAMLHACTRRAMSNQCRL